MSLMNLLLALSSTTVVSMILGTVFYSTSIGFGSIYIRSLWGTMNIYEANCKPKQNKRKATIVCLLSVIAYNAMLIFLLEKIYRPRTLNETLLMALFLVAVHLFQELPHLAYEVRSYGTLAIHTVFHFWITALPLFMLKFYFNLSK